MIQDHLNEENLHHAYLIEGEKEKILPEILEFFEKIKIKTRGNPDFYNITLDNFKMEEALDLRSMSLERGITAGKKIFILAINNFSLDSQGVLLRMFEEPIPNTHFFLIVPSADALLKTVLSRFYLIKTDGGMENELKEAEKFISLPLRERLDFLKEFLVEEDEEEDILPQNSVRSKALKFLNALETTLHNKLVSRLNLDIGTDFFDQIFTAREFLRQPGSSTKTLLESLAFSIPKL